MRIANLGSLPLSYVSWLTGQLANLPLPQPLARWTIGMFASAYGIDSTQATRSLEDFRSIGEFFTRDLKPEHRPLLGDKVFPVDGTLRSVHTVASDGSIPQIKGKTFTLLRLLAEDPLAARLSSGQVWNMYLSPKDAHHIYAPVSGRIIKTLHIQGALWPVNDFALRNVDGLFATNERVVTFIESAGGLVAVVMVGATNVGKISLRYTELETNLRPWKRTQKALIDHNPAVVVQCGEKIGTFKMGSSVIIVSENPLAEAESLKVFPRPIRYGEALA